MRTVSIGIALLALAAWPALPAGPAARACDLYRHGHGDLVHLSGHQDLDAARIAITTQDGKVTLLLTERDVAFQLSDRTVRRVRRQLRDTEDEQDNWFASAIVTAVTATVRGLIDHSVVCHVRDLRDVSYENGRLVFRGRNGRRVFDDAEVDHTDIATAFSERDAREFVREFRRLKAGG